MCEGSVEHVHLDAQILRQEVDEESAVRRNPPPTFAAARITLVGFSRAKKSKAASRSRRSSSADVFPSNLVKPADSRCRHTEEPTRPRWPAT